MNILFKTIFISNLSCKWLLIGNSVHLVGDGKEKEEEEGRGRRDKKQKTATGDGTFLGDGLDFSLSINSIKDALFFNVCFRCQIPRR